MEDMEWMEEMELMELMEDVEQMEDMEIMEFMKVGLGLISCRVIGEWDIMIFVYLIQKRKIRRMITGTDESLLYRFYISCVDSTLVDRL